MYNKSLQVYLACLIFIVLFFNVLKQGSKLLNIKKKKKLEIQIALTVNVILVFNKNYNCQNS